MFDYLVVVARGYGDVRVISGEFWLRQVVVVL